jgi:2'-5' RNA ligase
MSVFSRYSLWATERTDRRYGPNIPSIAAFDQRVDGMSPVSRYFLALTPDADARSALAALPLPPGGRRVHPDDLHLTLAFLGDLRAPSPGALLDELAAAVPGPGPTTVVLDRIELWPGPRVACAVGEAPEVAALAATLWRLLPGFGYRAEARPFRAHVALARGLPRASGAAPVVPLPQPVRWVSRELLLMASVAEPGLPGTPRYRILGARSLD